MLSLVIKLARRWRQRARERALHSAGLVLQRRSILRRGLAAFQTHRTRAKTEWRQGVILASNVIYLRRRIAFHRWQALVRRHCLHMADAATADARYLNFVMTFLLINTA